MMSSWNVQIVDSLMSFNSGSSASRMFELGIAEQSVVSNQGWNRQPSPPVDELGLGSWLVMNCTLMPADTVVPDTSMRQISASNGCWFVCAKCTRCVTATAKGVSAPTGLRIIVVGKPPGAAGSCALPEPAGPWIPCGPCGPGTKRLKRVFTKSRRL